MVAKSPPGRSVRPIERWNSVSPASSSGPSSRRDLEAAAPRRVAGRVDHSARLRLPKRERLAVE